MYRNDGRATATFCVMRKRSLSETSFVSHR